MAHGCALILLLIEYMERCRVGFWRTGSMLVLVYVWIWIYHYLWYDATWHHHNYIHMLFHYDGDCKLLCTDHTIVTTRPSATHSYSTTMTMTHDSALMMNKYMERCHVGVRIPESTLVLVHIWIWMCHYLVYDALWHHQNCALACYATTPG